MRRSILFLVVVFSLWAESASAREKWSLTLYHGTLAQKRLVDIFANRHTLESSYLMAAALGRDFAGDPDGLTWEWEGQVGKHYGKQHHWEFNALVAARWNRFPWDRYVDTSFAFGEGLSYAARTPRVERRDLDSTSQFLNYLLFEVTFGLPQVPRWHLVGRIHHRSGVFGLFNGVHGGSDFTAVGVKYLF